MHTDMHNHTHTYKCTCTYTLANTQTYNHARGHTNKAMGTQKEQGRIHAHALTHRCVGYGGFFLSVYLIYQTKPLEALDISYWARPRAEKEIQVRFVPIHKPLLNAFQTSEEVAACSFLGPRKGVVVGCA